MPNDFPVDRTWKDCKAIGIDLAIEHIKAQHAVWDHTDIPPRALLNIIEANLRALRELQK